MSNFTLVRPGVSVCFFLACLQCIYIVNIDKKSIYLPHLEIFKRFPKDASLKVYPSTISTIFAGLLSFPEVGPLDLANFHYLRRASLAFHQLDRTVWIERMHDFEDPFVGHIPFSVFFDGNQVEIVRLFLHFFLFRASGYFYFNEHNNKCKMQKSKRKTRIQSPKFLQFQLYFCTLHFEL